MSQLHQGQRILGTGKPLEEAQGAMILLHGRGSDAQDILSLAAEFQQPGFAYLAPNAAGNTWYPNRFIAPLDSNEPWLSSALQVISDLLADVGQAGIPIEKTLLLGFSQGACLALEYAARNPQPYGGVVGLSGGLIGPQGMTFRYPGSLAGTPVFLGCSDVDFHIPVERVRESATVFRDLGATVDERIYPGMGHTVNQDEIEAVRGLMQTLA